jgi:hypothetical protein
MWSPFRGGRHATRTVPKRRGVFAILVAIPGLVGFGAASANATGGYGHKVTLCHATASNSNPYVTVTVDKNSIKYQGHLAHVNGKVWPTPEWGDIIPAPESGCPGSELKKATAVNGTPVDSCGPTMNADINPATTEGVDYIKTVSGNTVTLTAKAKAGYELTNPTWSQSYTDKLVACPVEKPNPKPTKPGRSGGSGLGPDRDDTGFPVGLLGGFAFAGGMVLLAGRRRREAPNA